jgi:hypothetical protein
MVSWWHRDVLAAGKLPLMLCFLAFVITFVTTRTITRMIRDGRGPFRNQVTASGTHIHHAVPGIILLIIGAFTAVGGPDSLGWRSSRSAGARSPQWRSASAPRWSWMSSR